MFVIFSECLSSDTEDVDDTRDSHNHKPLYTEKGIMVTVIINEELIHTNPSPIKDDIVSTIHTIQSPITDDISSTINFSYPEDVDVESIVIPMSINQDDDMLKYAIYREKKALVSVVLCQKLFHPQLYSQYLIQPMLSNAMIIVAKSLIFKLLLSPFDSNNGIIMTADRPFGTNCLMNITRPAVLRTYFGRNIEAVSPSLTRKFTYGCTNISGNISTDPSKFITKPMPEQMYTLGRHLQSIACNISTTYHSKQIVYNMTTIIVQFFSIIIISKTRTTS